jgi:hypothetical protein
MAVVKSPKNIKRKKLWITKNFNKLNLSLKSSQNIPSPFSRKRRLKSYKSLIFKKKLAYSLISLSEGPQKI